MPVMSSSSPTARRVRRAGALILVAAALGVCTRIGSTAGPRFYPDDPIAREPESQDASKAQPYFMGSLLIYCFLVRFTGGLPFPAAVARHRQPAPAVARKFALPVLVALVEDRHGSGPKSFSHR